MFPSCTTWALAMPAQPSSAHRETQAPTGIRTKVFTSYSFAAKLANYLQTNSAAPEDEGA
jgi:hypothetical protein